jgi:hypothetical protein
VLRFRNVPFVAFFSLSLRSLRRRKRNVAMLFARLPNPSCECRCVECVSEMVSAPLLKTPQLPAELWTNVSDRVRDLDALLRLTCVNKSMQKSTENAITGTIALKQDDFLFHSVVEVLMKEIEMHVGTDMNFQETGRHHEPGRPVMPRGYWGYARGWDFVSGSVHCTYVPDPTTPIAKLSVRNGNVQTETMHNFGSKLKQVKFFQLQSPSDQATMKLLAHGKHISKRTFLRQECLHGHAYLPLLLHVQAYYQNNVALVQTWASILAATLACASILPKERCFGPDI